MEPDIGSAAIREPSQTPISIIDLERDTSSVGFDMFLHMSDPCPKCGAFNMRVGDYTCFGTCWPCEYHQ